MEEVGAQVAAPIFLSHHHQKTLSGMAKKRDLPYQTPNYHQRFLNPNPVDNWNPKSWEWDTVRFVAKPLDSADALPLAAMSTLDQPPPPLTLKKKSLSGAEEDDAALRLNLGGGLTCVVEDSAPRPNKRVRSGSPGSTTTYPMCQVDNCKEDLSSAKDYHRRHKVCELHSKSTKALVANQMQRFCQQCSRLFNFALFSLLLCFIVIVIVILV